MSGSSSSTTINFEDTSQYIFRNSSRNRGYFEGEAGYTSTDDDHNTNTQLLQDAELIRLNGDIDALALVGGLHHFAHAKATQGKVGRKARAGRGRREGR